MLTVVMPCRDAGPFVEAAVRSVLNQDLRDLELVVVDDGSTDETEAIVRRLAARDRRVRLLTTGGNAGAGAARNRGVDEARGRFLGFVDADDLLLPGAASAMVSTLQRTGSDMVVGGYRRHGVDGTHRPRLVARVHAKELLSTDAARFPQVTDEVVVWNRLYRTDFWRREVGTFPEDVNYEDREPALRASLRARAFDVVTRDVYSWRLADGRTTRSQAKSDVHDVRDRLVVLEREAALLEDAPAVVRSCVQRRWLDADLAPYLEKAPTAGPDYWNALQALVARAAADATAREWGAVGVYERLLAYVVAAGSQTDAAAIVGTRLEESSAVPLIARGDRFAVDLPVVAELATDIPSALLEVEPGLLQLVAGVRRVWMQDGLLHVRGWAYLPGLEAGAEGARLHVFTTGDGRREELPTTTIDDPEIDVVAGDPWRSYTTCGFSVSLEVPAARTVHLDVVLERDEGRWTRPLTVDVPRDGRTVEVPEGSATQVHVEDVTLEGGAVVVHGRATPPVMGLAIGLVSSRRQVATSVQPDGEGCFRAVLDASTPAVPSDGYFVRWSCAGVSQLSRWARAGDSLLEGAIDRDGSLQRLTARGTPTGAVTVTVSPPLSVTERSRYGQRRLRTLTRPEEPLRPAVLFETFTGKSCGDNPGAVFRAMRDQGTAADLWWSVKDLSVRVPEGATPLVIGSSDWHSALRSAAILVTNNSFPYWFQKSPGQLFVQTWHGTPIKRLLWDLPSAAVPLTYARLMRRQVPMWDLLLAQSAQAERDLRTGLGYTGDVLVMEQPRNVPLVAQGREASRVRARADLGIRHDEKVVLYAPTWREHQRTRSRAMSWEDQLDVSSVVEATGVRLLLRGHHVAAYAPLTVAGATDVTEHPDLEALLLAADVLVSDYSSVLHDWKLTGRPAIVHVPDLDTYRDVERGFYGTWPESTSWPATFDDAGLIEAVRTACDEPPGPPPHDYQRAERELDALVQRLKHHLQTIGARSAEGKDRI